MIRSESIRQLRMAMDLLTEDHRSILVLRNGRHVVRRYRRMPGYLIGTVRSRLSRARNALKQQLELLPDWAP